MREVISQLLAAWILLAPSPSLVHFWYRKRIDGILAVHSRTRVRVPVPDAAQSGRSLDDLRIEAFFSQLVEYIDTSKAGSNYADVQIQVGVAVGRSVALVVTIGMSIGHWLLPDASLHYAAMRLDLLFYKMSIQRLRAHENSK